MSNVKQLITDYFDAIDGKAKTEVILDKFISDASLKEHIRFFESAFPAYELKVDDMIQEGNKVAVQATFRGKHLGELMGIPPTGKAATISLMLIYEVKDNKIASHSMVADQFSLMQQLGVIK